MIAPCGMPDKDHKVGCNKKKSMLLLKNAFLDRIGAHTLLFPSYFCVSNPTPPLPSHYTSEGDEITTEKRNNTTERERERENEGQKRPEEWTEVATVMCIIIRSLSVNGVTDHQCSVIGQLTTDCTVCNLLVTHSLNTEHVKIFRRIARGLVHLLLKGRPPPPLLGVQKVC